MVIFPLKIVIFPLKIAIFPLKIVIFPLKMVVFPWKMVITVVSHWLAPQLGNPQGQRLCPRHAAAPRKPGIRGAPGSDGQRPSRNFKGYLGVSENSVPLNPMVNDHYPY